MSGCDSELNAHFYSAALLKYHAPDTWHDTTPNHISWHWVDQSLFNDWFVAAWDWTHDLLFLQNCHSTYWAIGVRADTLPNELSGPVYKYELSSWCTWCDMDQMDFQLVYMMWYAPDKFHIDWRISQGEYWFFLVYITCTPAEKSACFIL